MKKAKLLLNLIGILIICFHMVPIYISLVASLKAKSDLSIKWALPKGIYWDNYLMALKDGEFFNTLMNTFIIVIFTVAITIAIGAMTGYVLARLQNRITNGVLLTIVGVMMIPSLTLIVPLYKLMLQINAINTYWGIIILSASFHLPLCVFFYTNFIKTIPVELDEAAKIDGCRTTSIFYRMILPQLGPVTATIAIITSIATYNEYLFPLYFLQKADMRMITLYVSTYFNENSYLNAASAAALLGAIPAILVFIIFQKHFVSGALQGLTK
ncbi:carbohydrate ABC transporter permease [Paenibacillus elgii]|uniref:carbohydrate ABC transporter permease n=1 Tax=Paenibacillus elgii TaxID=189691 RepID=UPI000248CB0C|nr:carbohydrate ABC transporter permease [Paenibacillus elgii]